jgi:hypothetical protein
LKYFWGDKNFKKLAALWAGALSCSKKKKKSREKNATGKTR